MNSNIPCKLFIGFTLLTALVTACASPTQAPTTPTPLVFVTETLPSISTETPTAIPTFTQTLPPVTGDATALPAFTPTVPSTVPPVSTNICADPQASALIDSLKKAVTTADGPLLASLVSPTSGMDVAFYHNGNVINYDQEHAKFLFETTFEANWGTHPASGEETIGSFHDIVVPELVKIFNQPYTLHCNELKYGGASYPVIFPYDKDFYSIYFPGTEANGNLDWHTWVAGIEYVNGKPYLYALTQFFWEP
jgi:hypothetical protein